MNQMFNRSLGKKLVTLAALLPVMTMLGGCGETPYELEKNEREIIVNYAAHIVAKYNTKQPEGYTYVFPEEEEAEETESTQEPETEETNEEQKNENAQQGETGDETETQQQESVSLTKALGLSKQSVSAVYTGLELTDRYESVVPSAKGQLMVVHVALTNTGRKSTKISFVEKMPIFRATINEDQQVTADLTLLTNDLTTLEKKLKAGKTVDTVLIFSLGDTSIQSVHKLTMTVNLNGKKSFVEFL